MAFLFYFLKLWCVLVDRFSALVFHLAPLDAKMSYKRQRPLSVSALLSKLVL